MFAEVTWLPPHDNVSGRYVISLSWDYGGQDFGVFHDGYISNFAPSQGGCLAQKASVAGSARPLANFGSFAFSTCYAGADTRWDATTQSYMTDQFGALARPPTDGDSVTAVFGWTPCRITMVAGGITRATTFAPDDQGTIIVVWRHS